MPSGDRDALTLLRELFDLRSRVDELVERGLVRHGSVRDVLHPIFEAVTEKLGLEHVFVHTYGDDLELHLFASWEREPAAFALPDEAAIFEATAETRRERITQRAGEHLVLAQPLDVAGTWFGRAGFVVREDADAAHLHDALDAMCEVLDNFLFAIRAAREKHTVLMKLGKVLRHRVLSEGLKQAVAVLATSIPIDRIALVYVAEESAARTLHVQMFEGSELKVDTMASQAETHSPLRLLGKKYLAGETAELLEHLGVENAQEEVLINGITKSVVVGKVVVTSKTGSFNTYDRELLSAFAGFIRQRVVDFNKEWRALATAFREEDVGRLLSTDDYERSHLAPREETVAILYTDLASFTKLSESVLKTPAAVAALVEAWSRDAVELVWHHGGVFDKMVGDCIIALFGPPFYESTPGERLAAAIRCAADIRRMTNNLPNRLEFEHLRGAGLGVSSGVNLAPLFVGRFGPNSNFTGFSSGMNNTARLQGCAVKDEILVMEGAIAALPSGHPFTFGDARSAAVKNVAEPLQFRALK